jgi:hypothetical protein
LLQVLVSIQSLIFVREPYFNEPGYESEMGSPHGVTRSRKYNERIRMSAIRWAMTNQLEHPSEGFEGFIETHFLLRGNGMLAEIEQWLDEAKTSENKSYRRGLFAVTRKFVEQLEKLHERASAKEDDGDDDKSKPSFEPLKVPGIIKQNIEVHASKKKAAADGSDTDEDTIIQGLNFY